MIKQLKIGNVTLPNNLILGPMAGVTDLPFRLLCKEQGAGLLCMEMVSAKAILYKNRNTEPLLTIDERENPVSLQLFGSDPEIVSSIAHSIEERPFDIGFLHGTIGDGCISIDMPDGLISALLFGSNKSIAITTDDITELKNILTT